MSGAEVISGKDNWLFLREGTNKSLSYLNGSDPVSPSTSRQWFKTVQHRHLLFPNSIHLICPEKLAVFPEFLPDFQLDKSRLGAKLESNNSVIYPVKLLRNSMHEANYTYSKVDTHFNDFGALLAAKTVAEHFGVDSHFDPTWSTEMIRGDLGIKISEKIREPKLVLANSPRIQIHDNGLTNRGRMIHCRNTEAPSSKLLIFGDSFSGINLTRMLALFFSDVLFVHSLAVDYGIVKKFQPDFLLFELAERFLRDKPTDGLRIESLIMEKILGGQGTAVKAWQAKHDNPTTKMIDWQLLDFGFAHLEREREPSLQ